MSDDLEKRVRQLDVALKRVADIMESMTYRIDDVEAELAEFFDALATDDTPPAADAAREAGTGPAAAVPGPPESGGVDDLVMVLRHRIKGCLSWERLTPAEVLAMIDAAVRELPEPQPSAEFERVARWLIYKIYELPQDETHAAIQRLSDALLTADAPQARAMVWAEWLATTLLLNRDGETLRWHGMRATCWDADGRLIGVGATRGAARRDVVEHEGHDEAETWLTVDEPDDTNTQQSIDPAMRRHAAQSQEEAVETRVQRDQPPQTGTLSAAVPRRKKTKGLGAGIRRSFKAADDCEALERLAATLLAARDADALMLREHRVGVWSTEGRLIGSGTTRDNAARDAILREGQCEDELWLTAEVPTSLPSAALYATPRHPR